MENIVFSIWLQTVCGVAGSAAAPILARFGTAKAVYEAEDFEEFDGKYSCIKELKKKDITQALEIYKACRNRDYGMIDHEHAMFPSALKKIKNPPLVLYYKGKMCSLEEEVCIGMVGARNASDFGSSVAEEYAFHFAQCGGIVVSGLAKGIDSMSHRGALRAGGFTIGILGTPIDKIYPWENKDLFYEMYEKGLVMSEMYPGCRQTKSDFPHRNRIISALSKAVVICEASERSGALITAKHALEQGKRLYAIPGAVGPENAGTNSLIKQGTEAATTPLDVLGDLAVEYPKKIKTENYSASTKRISSYGIKIEPKNKDIEKPEPLPAKSIPIREKPPILDEEGKIIDLLEKHGVFSADEIAEIINISIKDALTVCVKMI